MTRLLSLALVLTAINACSTAPARKIVIVPTGREAAYRDWHYAPAIRVGDTVYLSGVPASGEGTYEERVTRMFERVGETLRAAGATWADVVEITTFHTQPRDTPAFEAEYQRFAVIHAKYFDGHYPAWTAVGTTALLADGAPVEMRVVAVVGTGRADR